MESEGSLKFISGKFLRLAELQVLPVLILFFKCKNIVSLTNEYRC